MQTPFARPMERRAALRQPCRTEVRVFLEPDDQALCFGLDSADVSPEGVFVRSELLYPVGQWLDLELQVPGRVQPVRARGQVVRVHSQRQAPGPGMAVWLPRLSEEERNALGRMSAAAVRRLC